MHALIAQNVLSLFARTGQPVRSAKRKQHYKGRVEKNPLNNGRIADQVIEQFLASLKRLGFKIGPKQINRKTSFKFVLGMDGGNFPVHVVHLAFVHSERLRDVLVRVRVNRFLKCLTQKVLTTLGSGNMLVHSEHEIIRNERIRSRKKSEDSLDHTLFILE